jgi:hypothetical protein
MPETYDIFVVLETPEGSKRHRAGRVTGFQAARDRRNAVIEGWCSQGDDRLLTAYAEPSEDSIGSVSIDPKDRRGT